MKHETYSQFKRRIINESLIENVDINKFYGLSREHIELTLGIRVPFLLETIDRRTEERILREQYLFEQFMQSLRNAAAQAGQAVRGAATQAKQNVSNAVTAVKTATPAGVYQAAKGAVQNVVQDKLQKVKDAAGIFKALGLIFQYPTLVKEFGQSVSKEISRYIQPVQDFMGKAINWLKEKTEKAWEFVKNVFNKAYDGITNILSKFRGLQGWQKATLGIGLLIVGKWAWDQASSKIEELKKSFEEKSIGVSAESVSKAILKNLTELAKNVIEKIFGQAAIAALSSFAGPIGPFVTALSKIVGNMGFIIETLSPVTNSFIDRYNQITNPNITYARAAELGQSTTQKAGQAIGKAVGTVRQAVGLQERRVLISNILYGPNKS
jgi:phage-related protein